MNNDVSVEDEDKRLWVGIQLKYPMDNKGNLLIQPSELVDFIKQREHEAELRGQRSIAVGTLEDEIKFHKNTIKECKDLIKRLTAPTTDDTSTDGGE